MFELELAQLIHRDGTVEATIADPEKGPSQQELMAFRDAALASPYLSRTLRRELEQRSGRRPAAPVMAQPTTRGTRKRWRRQRPPATTRPSSSARLQFRSVRQLAHWRLSTSTRPS